MRSIKELLTKPNIILVSIPILLALYIRFGMAPNFDFFFGKFVSNPIVESSLRIF